MKIATIYSEQSDYPGKFVVRVMRILPRRTLRYARPLAVVDTLAEARAAVGLRFPWMTCIGREENDHHTIVESHL